MNEEIFETPSSSPNFQTELAAQLAELVPEAVADGKIDVIKLQELLAQDAAETSERFGLFWPGKQRALRVAQMPTTATLRPEPEKSKEWDTTKNIFIEGDNLEVLKILQKHYHGKIKMIYIDPPYNTGKDFVYPDNFKEGLENYLEWTKQVTEEGKKISTNSETEGRYHSNWLNMMYPRLKLARNLLKNDGVIFISIDDNELDNLRKIANEIFGEPNFLGVIVWRTATDNNPTNIATDHEYLVAYAKNVNSLSDWEAESTKAAQIADKYSELRRILGEDNEKIQRELRKWIRAATSSGQVELDGVSHYSYVDERGVYYPGNSANTKPGGYNFDIIHPITGQVTRKPANGWRWPQATFEAAAQADEVHWGEDHTSVPKIKKRIETATELLKSSYYEDNRATSALVADLLGVKAFDNPKSINLLRRLIRFTTDGDDIVLDFFAGSGSTAHAVMLQNVEDGSSRRFILVQLPEPTPEKSPARESGFSTISELSRKRITVAGDRVIQENARLITGSVSQIDCGFKAYSLADSNFSKWQVPSDIGRDILEQHLFDLRGSSDDGASSASVLVEILLKQGYSLTEEVSEISIAGLNVWSIGGGVLLAYLDENSKPSLDALKTLLDKEPSKVVVLEDAFQGDDELKTNITQICRSKNIEFWTA